MAKVRSPYQVLVLKSVRQSLASASDVYIRTWGEGGGNTIPESVLSAYCKLMKFCC